MPITKRPCANCPFRKDGCGVELQPGRLEEIIADLLTDDSKTFVCHKTLGTKERMTCAGALAVMTKLGRMPVIGRLGLLTGVIGQEDIEASSEMVIDSSDLSLPVRAFEAPRERRSIPSKRAKVTAE